MAVKVCSVLFGTMTNRLGRKDYQIANGSKDKRAMNIRPPGTSAPAGRARGAPSGGALRTGTAFQVPGALAETSAAAPLEAIGLEGLLSLQEIEPAPERDARSRSRGEALLAALSRLQRDGLGAERDPDLLEQMARLCKNVPQAADPRLREAVVAITLRVHVELARQSLSISPCLP